MMENHGYREILGNGNAPFINSYARWDENDYAVEPIYNQVVTIVDTNCGFHQLQSGEFYTHFSLLRSLEGGLGIPCLNHACDAGTNTVSDLFGESDAKDRDTGAR
jgi:hypothetical protein